MELLTFLRRSQFGYPLPRLVHSACHRCHGVRFSSFSTIYFRWSPRPRRHPRTLRGSKSCLVSGGRSINVRLGSIKLNEVHALTTRSQTV